MHELRRTNRMTKAKIVARCDDFLGWITFCETHGYHAEHPTKTAAINWMACPVVWCQGCQSEKDGAK